MKKMKAIALILVAFTLIFVAACSGSKTDTNTGDDKAQTETQPDDTKEEPKDETKEEPKPEEPEQPAFDMKGEKITILTWVKEDVPTGDTEQGQKRLEKQQEVEKKYNVKIEWKVVPWGEPNNMIAKAGLAGEPVADITLMDLYFSYPLINQGLLRPVDEFFDFNDPKWPKGIQEWGKINGKMYGFKEFVNVGVGIYYNKTLFKKEGLPDLHELEQSGQWTWEKFLEIAKQATKDTNGDGTIDQWGLTNHAPILARLLASSNGAKIIDYVDGKYKFDGDDQKLLEALHFVDDLYNKSKVAAPNKGDFNDHGESQKIFSSGKAAMVSGELWEGKERKDMTDEQGFVSFPRGPSATDQNYHNANENFTMYYMPANAKHPKETAQIWQELILWDQLDQNKRALFEEQRVAEEIDVESMMKATETVSKIYFPGNGTFGDVVWGITNKGLNPETELEKVKQSIQSQIDQALNTAAK